MSEIPPILYCHCARAQATPAPVREAALRALVESGRPFEAVADLCGLAAEHSPKLSAAGVRAVIACHPRTVRCLFAAAGAPALPEGTRWINLREETPEGAAAAVRELSDLPAAPVPARSLEEVRATLETEAARDGWNPWFPVLDASRCTNCLQCLNFCLFGVYAVDDAGSVEVRSPRQCKPDCPACARVCPEGAILFPKHPAGVIHGGEVAEDGAAVHDAVKADLSSLLGGDVYALLRQRNAPRFSKDRDPALALAERRKFLEALERNPDPPATQP